MMAQTEMLHVALREMEGINRATVTTGRSMASLSRHTREFAGNLRQATSTLLRWTGVTGVVGSLAGLLSAEGIGRLASYGAGTFRSSMGYAGPTTPGQVGAAGAYSILSPNAMLGQLTEMLTTAGGKQGLAALGIGPNMWGQGAGALLPTFIRRLQGLAQRTPEPILGDVLGGMGLGQFGEQARILRRMTPGQVEELDAIRIRNEREMNTLTTDMLMKWVRLNATLDLAGTKIHYALVEGLTGLEPQIERITNAFSDAVANFLKSEEVKKWMEDLSEALEHVDMEKFAVGLEDAAKKVVGFVDALTGMITAIGSAAKWIMDTIGTHGGMVGGAAAGAAIGGAIAGPPGAAVGGVVGAGAGLANEYSIPPDAFLGGSPTDNMAAGAAGPGGERIVASAAIPPAAVSGSGAPLASGATAATSGGGAPPPVGANRWYTGAAPAHIAEHGGFNVAGLRAREGGFRTYPNAYAGVADMGDLLRSYPSKYGANTIRSIFNKWAPPTDRNNTPLLIQRASQWTGLGPDQPLNLEDPTTLRAMMIAMNRNEFGGNMTMDEGALNQYVSGAGGAASTSRFAGQVTGQLQIGDAAFRFGSGGRNGAQHIPFGDYPLGGPVGPWGQAHGAIGIGDSAGIPDPSLGRMRTGIELHAGMSDTLITDGCMAVAGADWPKVKGRVQAMIAQYGSAYLHVGPSGATITPGRTAGAAGAVARAPVTAPPPATGLGPNLVPGGAAQVRARSTSGISIEVHATHDTGAGAPVAGTQVAQ